MISFVGVFTVGWSGGGGGKQKLMGGGGVSSLGGAGMVSAGRYLIR